jgi:hypothetical protein
MIVTLANGIEATGTQPEVRCLRRTSKKLLVQLYLTGAGTPTVTGAIQGSIDGSTWIPIFAFTEAALNADDTILDETQEQWPYLRCDVTNLGGIGEKFYAWVEIDEKSIT